jgi:hypothetical protein
VPLNAFSDIVSAAKQGNVFLVIVAFTAILSEPMPISLGNVPLRVVSGTCKWMAVGILSLMWLIVVASFFVKWPHMPADSKTIARATCYVFDSSRFRNLEGLGVRVKK